MRDARRGISLLVGAAVMLSLFCVSSVAAAHLTSPSFQLDTNLGGSFGGATNSTNYKMISIGGEAVVGNGASGSYKIGQGYGAVAAPSMQLSLQPSGLAYYFPFDENSGTIAYDASAAAAQATFSGSPTWVPGKLGSALLFNGSSDSAAVAAAPAITSGRLSVSAWVKVASTSNANTYQTLFECQTSATNSLFSLWINKSTGALGASSSFSGTTYTAASGVNLNDSLWHFITYTVDGSRINIYIDGTLSVSTSYSGTLDTPAASMVIAKSLYNGTVDDLRIFNRALSPQEISSTYATQNSGVTSALNFGSLAGGVSSTANVDAVVQTNSSIYSLAVNQDHDMQTTASTGATPDNNESFSGAVPGASITTSNTTYSAIVAGAGATATAQNSSPLHGTYATFNAGTSSDVYGKFNLAAPSVLYSRFYFRIQAYPTGRNAILMQTSDSSVTDLSDLKITTTGLIALSNLSNPTAYSASAAPLNQWIRAEVWWNRPASTQTLRLFYGANVDGTTPDETLTAAAGGSSTAATIRFGDGYVPTTSYTVDIDDSATSTAGWLGPAVTTVGATIPPISSTISSPAAWSEGITTGLGFSVTASPSVDSRWGGGSNYAQFPLTPTTFYTQLTKTGAKRDVIGLASRVSVRGDQAQGVYSNTVTVTGTTSP
jgi:hypothetical protein